MATLTRNNSPSQRWTKMHGGRMWRGERYAKRVFRTYLGAWIAALAVMCLAEKRPGGHPRPYACRWGADYHDGETSRKHYHIGRRSKVRSYD